jgi:uncharacterized Zn finger protein
VKRFDWRDGFPPARPREAKGGIRARSRRGAFAETWWARRWLSVLEGFDIGTRLHRGRGYARRGQVLGIAVGNGRVEARVQGSRASPYDVVIEVKTLSDRDWQELGRSLAAEARFVAKLLASEMPADIEEAFRRAGLSLFPERHEDLRTSCSCPDWSNPCKHIAAVYYLLGEEFDRDPFLLFRLRGRDRAELVRLFGPAAATRPTATAEATPEPSRLPSVPDAFWRGRPLPDDLFGEVATPAASAVLLRRLGRFPFWRGKEPPGESLPPLYEAASRLGLGVWLGEKPLPDEAGRRARTGL